MSKSDPKKTKKEDFVNKAVIVLFAAVFVAVIAVAIMSKRLGPKEEDETMNSNSNSKGELVFVGDALTVEDEEECWVKPAGEICPRNLKYNSSGCCELEYNEMSQAEMLLSMAGDMILDQLVGFADSFIRETVARKVSTHLGEFATKKLAREAAEKAAREAAEKAVTEIIEKAAEEFGEEVASETAERITRRITNEAIETAAEGAVREAAEKAARESAEKIAKKAGMDMKSKATKKMIEKLVQKAGDEASERVMREAVDRLATRVAQDAVMELSEKSAKQTTKAGLSQTVGTLRNKVAKKIATKVVTKTAFKTVKRQLTKVMVKAAIMAAKVGSKLARAPTLPLELAIAMMDFIDKENYGLYEDTSPMKEFNKILKSQCYNLQLALGQDYPPTFFFSDPKSENKNFEDSLREPASKWEWMGRSWNNALIIVQANEVNERMFHNLSQDLKDRITAVYESSDNPTLPESIQEELYMAAYDRLHSDPVARDKNLFKAFRILLGNRTDYTAKEVEDHLAVLYPLPEKKKERMEYDSVVAKMRGLSSGVVLATHMSKKTRFGISVSREFADMYNNECMAEWREKNRLFAKEEAEMDGEQPYVAVYTDRYFGVDASDPGTADNPNVKEITLETHTTIMLPLGPVMAKCNFPNKATDPEKYGVTFDIHEMQCNITREYCDRFGLDYDNSKWDCYLDGAQYWAEMVLGRTIIRGPQRRFRDIMDSGGPVDTAENVGLLMGDPFHANREEVAMARFKDHRYGIGIVQGAVISKDPTGISQLYANMMDDQFHRIHNRCSKPELVALCALTVFDTVAFLPFGGVGFEGYSRLVYGAVGPMLESLMGDNVANAANWLGSSIYNNSHYLVPRFDQLDKYPYLGHAASTTANAVSHAASTSVNAITNLSTTSINEIANFGEKVGSFAESAGSHLGNELQNAGASIGNAAKSAFGF